MALLAVMSPVIARTGSSSVCAVSYTHLDVYKRQLSVRVNRGEATTETFEPIDDLQEMTVEGNIGSVRWTVESADSTLFYGLAMDLSLIHL